MTDPVTIIIDDKNFAALTVINDSVVSAGGIFYTDFYNGSMFVPFGQKGPFWTWALLFEGISVSLVGITPPSGYNQTIGLVGPERTEYSYTYPSAAVGGPFYTSLTLPASGQLSVGLINVSGIAIDYALVTAGNTTNLQGQTIIVDDANPEIFWNGNWSAKDNFTESVPCAIASTQYYEEARDPTVNNTGYFPFTANVSSHANTTHQSSNVGDSFTFQFAGTSLLISGFPPGAGIDADWLLHMEFTVDGNTTTKVFTNENGEVMPNFVYFNATFDTATGNHTLVAKVVDAAGSPPPAAHIDYITYRPSFVTIADKPKFPPPASIAMGAQSSTSSATGAPSSASSTATVPPMLGVPVEHRTSVGAIVGGVMGGCLLIALLAATFYLMRRRRTRERDQFAPEPFDSSTTSDMRERNGHSKREPLSVDANALAERRNDIAAEIQHLQESRHGEEDEQTVEERLRALQAQMDTLTHHLVPPSYASV
ncbi:hypothetical protein DFH06DRAFT_1293807 [Mycena polygramma]|nr:hypothetical protein DFH06DRAFT_1293807 [Mycena polygramma]